MYGSPSVVLCPSGVPNEIQTCRCKRLDFKNLRSNLKNWGVSKKFCDAKQPSEKSVGGAAPTMRDPCPLFTTSLCTSATTIQGS